MHSVCEVIETYGAGRLVICSPYLLSLSCVDVAFPTQEVPQAWLRRHRTAAVAQFARSQLALSVLVACIWTLVLMGLDFSP